MYVAVMNWKNLKDMYFIGIYASAAMKPAYEITFVMNYYLWGKFWIINVVVQPDIKQVLCKF